MAFVLLASVPREVNLQTKQGFSNNVKHQPVIGNIPEARVDDKIICLTYKAVKGRSDVDKSGR